MRRPISKGMREEERKKGSKGEWRWRTERDGRGRMRR